MNCLFVIDYQNDFVDGSLGFPGAEKLDAGIAARILEYGPGRVWYTQDTHFDDYLTSREGKNLPVVHCIRSSHGWLNYGQTAKVLKEVGAVGIEKYTFGMDPANPETLSKLPQECPEQIELCGLVSNICVLSNAAVLQGHFPNAQLVVDAHLIGSFDPEKHAATLSVLEGLQVKIKNR